MGHFYTYINIFWSLKVKTQSMKFLKVVCVRLGKKIWNSIISNRCYFLVNYFIGFKITTYDFSRMMWIFSQFSGKGSKCYLYSIIYLVHYIPLNDIIHYRLEGVTSWATQGMQFQRWFLIRQILFIFYLHIEGTKTKHCIRRNMKDIFFDKMIKKYECKE